MRFDDFLEIGKISLNTQFKSQKTVKIFQPIQHILSLARFKLLFKLSLACWSSVVQRSPSWSVEFSFGYARINRNSLTRNVGEVRKERRKKIREKNLFLFALIISECVVCAELVSSSEWERKVRKRKKKEIFNVDHDDGADKQSVWPESWSFVLLTEWWSQKNIKSFFFVIVAFLEVEQEAKEIQQKNIFKGENMVLFNRLRVDRKVLHDSTNHKIWITLFVSLLCSYGINCQGELKREKHCYKKSLSLKGELELEHDRVSRNYNRSSSNPICANPRKGQKF